MLCAVPQAPPKPQFSHSHAAPSGAATHVCTVPPGQRLQTRSGPGAPEEGCQALPGCLLISFGALQFPFPITGPAPCAGRACRVLLAPQLPGGSRTEGWRRWEARGAERGGVQVLSPHRCLLQKPLESSSWLGIE